MAVDERSPAGVDAGVELAHASTDSPAPARPSGGEAFFEVRDIVKSYGSQTVLRGINLSIDRGEILCLLGPSGCGKSTLLNLIGGVAPLDGGVVRLAGKDITRTPMQKRNIGFVFQSYALFPHMTAAQNIGFGLRVRKVGRAQIEAEVDRLLNLVGLVGRGGHKPLQLSGGEQQRVALARALALQPALLLLDEPFSNLDAALRAELRAELRRIQRETQVTTIMVTHDQAEAFDVADRIALMRSGSLIQLGLPRELYETPQTEFAARFVGDANVLSGPVEPGPGGPALRYGDNLIPLPPGFATAGPVKFMLRPEHATLHRRTATGVQPAVAGEVRDARYRGNGWRYVVQVDATDDTVVVWEESSHLERTFAIGEAVLIGWAPESAYVIPPVAAGVQ